MANEVTKQIMNMVSKAENRKNQLDNMIKNLYKKRDADRARAYRDLVRAQKMKGVSDVEKTKHAQAIAGETKQVMDENHEIAELKRKRADVDKKISEMKHWTSQSEYEDDTKRAQALGEVSKLFGSI